MNSYVPLLVEDPSSLISLRTSASQILALMGRSDGVRFVVYLDARRSTQLEEAVVSGAANLPGFVAPHEFGNLAADVLVAVKGQVLGICESFIFVKEPDFYDVQFDLAANSATVPRQFFNAGVRVERTRCMRFLETYAKRFDDIRRAALETAAENINMELL